MVPARVDYTVPVRVHEIVPVGVPAWPSALVTFAVDNHQQTTPVRIHTRKPKHMMTRYHHLKLLTPAAAPVNIVVACHEL